MAGSHDHALALHLPRRKSSNVMTLAKINRMIRAAIRAARQEGAPVVEVKIGDEATVRIPLVPDDKPIAESDEVVL
jgi:hypothetical protein